MLNLCFKDNFPKWIDLRSNANCPDVLDDSILNISPISSIVNCIRYLLKHNNQEDFKISRIYLYYCLKNNLKNIDLKNTLNFIKEKGVCSEKDYPYDISKIDITPNIKELKYFKLDFKPVKNKVKYIKYELMNNRPVLVELKKKFYTIYCTTIYGYRSSINCFICMNSVGKEFGERGFFYLPYNHVKKHSSNLYSITSVS
jgi:hypothetical protein